MKKTKLLVSLVALMLVISICACSNAEVEEPECDEDEVCLTSDDIESETSILSNYTLNISLFDLNGNPITIPSYDSIYIQGSWDSWNEWILLVDVGDETGSVFTTTFNSISEGKYFFKGVIGFSEDNPSWNLTEIITDNGNNASFEVSKENGDNYTNNLTFVIDTNLVPINEEIMDDDEIIARAILEQVVISYVSSPWEAFYGECYDQSLSSLTALFLSVDINGFLYGTKKENDSESGTNNFQYYYFENVEHFYNASTGDYSFNEINENYIDLFNEYAIGLSELASLDFEDFGDDWEISHTSGSSYYTLVVKKESTYSATCRVSNSNYTFTKIEVSSGEEELNTFKSYSAEPTSTSRVEQEVEKYDFSDWIYGEGIDPIENIFNAVLEEDNYTILIEYFEIYSDEYGSASERNSDYQNTLVYTDSYVKITFTSDVVLMEYYLSYQDYVSGKVFDIELYVNNYEDESLYLYFLYEDNKMYLALDLGEYGFTNWQGYLMSLYDFVDSGSANYIKEGETTIGDDGPQTNYIFDINFASGYSFYLNLIDSLFDCGNWFVYMGYVYGPSTFEYIAYSSPNSIGYTSIYYADLEQWITTLDTGLRFLNNGSSYWVEEDIARATVYNIGTSSISNDFVIVDYPY